MESIHILSVQTPPFQIRMKYGSIVLLFLLAFTDAVKCDGAARRIDDSLSFAALPSTFSVCNYSSCDQCNNATGCHFCASDNLCHPYLSPYGCAVGVTCSELKDCIRHEQQFFAFGKPEPETIAVAVLVACVVVMIPFILMTKLARPGDQQRPDAKTMQALRLERALANEAGQVTVDSEFAHLAPNPHYFELSSFSKTLPVHNDFSARRPRAGTDSDDEQVGWTNSDTTPGFWQRCKGSWQSCCSCTRYKLYRTFRWTFMILLALSIPCVTVAILYYPQYPDYSMCSRKIHWGSILANITSGHLYSDVEMLFSIYNPNRFDVDVQGLDASIFWQGVTVANGHVGKERFSAGCVRDVVGLLHVSPGVITAAEMAAAYALGTLDLDVRLIMKSDVYAFRHKLLRYNATYSTSTGPVSAVDVSTRWCKCHE